MISEEKRSLYFRLSCLILLTVQTSALILFMRHSLHNSKYIASSVVVTVEVAKLILAFLAELISQPPFRRTPMTVLKSLWRDFDHNRRQVLRLALPALLYAVQNNLGYFALARLSAVSFQVIQQLKILTTALMAVWMMGRRLCNYHWVALCLLTIGVIFVQLANVSGKHYSAPTDVSSGAAWTGFAALLANSVSSGFAGIYFERLVKGSGPTPRPPNLRRTLSSIIKGERHVRTIWLQSIELGIFGLLFSLLVAFWGEGGQQIRQSGFFFGYDRMTWMVVAIQACGGMLVAMVVRYADTILKAFATSASIVLSSIITYGILGQELSGGFLVGATLVIISVYVYAMADRSQTGAKQE